MSKVFVMMSGGVDSSVAAAELKNQGHEVIGVYMKCWSVEQLESLGAERELYGCFWEQDAQDARLVADKLKIPFYVWDFEEQYKAEVVDYMLAEYAAGRTPNPDVMCNSSIKFGVFFRRAMSLGAEFVATGHYARKITPPWILDRTLDFKLKSQSILARGTDEDKDQSYFLWKVSADILDKIIFPIGDFQTKSEVRKKAQELSLLTSDKPDSQGLCFIGKVPLRQLLMQTLGSRRGKILNIKGEILGEHLGAFLYTVGQRTGLKLGGGPWFVLETSIKENVVIVAHETEEDLLYKTRLTATNLNWLVEFKKSELTLQAQIRYRQKAVTCQIQLDMEETSVKVDFEEPVRAVSSGQSIVFYHENLLLGGGVIL
jgi:tRNA-uridine 2-sulfurtransferase